MAENRTPAEVADEIAEAVRTLNYMTGDGGSVELEYPADLAQVLVNLKIADRMPQLFGQMAPVGLPQSTTPGEWPTTRRPA